MTNTLRRTDDAARQLAQDLLATARHGALGVLTNTAMPMVTRVAVLWHAGAILTLVSDLSHHTKALALNPACSLLIEQPGDKGDPLNHPRLTLQCLASDADKPMHKDIWLSAHPKAKLYFDFADFRILTLTPTEAHLYGGFGKAFQLTSTDLGK